MSTASPAAPAAPVAPAKKERDPRIDFFRGLAFIIIFIAHVPDNWPKRWIPAVFGFSDATEMFVFMSGFAAGIAFGTIYLRAGWVVGTIRIGFRAWQVYVAHLLMFFFITLFMVVATRWFTTGDYVGQLNLYYFFEHTADALVGLFTLNYVPNYFDILPMYIVILTMIPVFMALGRVHPWLALGACVLLYAYNWWAGVNDWSAELQFPAEVRPDVDRAWFFNPFGWQLIFFTGLALSVGWLKAPKPRVWLIVLCVAYLIVSALLWRKLQIRPFIEEDIWQPLVVWWTGAPLGPDYQGFWYHLYPRAVDGQPGFPKTNLWILRYLHFLALAYIVVLLLRGRHHWLKMAWARPIAQCGQQSLPIFLCSMTFSRLAGVMLDQFGEDHDEIANWIVLLVNAFWIAMLIAIAYLLAFIKASPWKKQGAKPPKSPPPPGTLPTFDAVANSPLPAERAGEGGARPA